jgi:hypothetical protein
VDGTSYERSNGGTWEINKPIDAGLVVPPSVDEHQKARQVRNVAWFIEDSVVNGRPVKVYETKSSYTYEEKKGRVTYVGIVRYWIGTDGLLLKKSAENFVFGQPTITKGVTVYEYENIKITAPVK